MLKGKTEREKNESNEEKRLKTDQYLLSGTDVLNRAHSLFETNQSQICWDGWRESIPLNYREGEETVFTIIS